MLLKPCPFCGAIPVLEWESWPECGPHSGAYSLYAPHTKDCFFYRMNGLNTTGKITSFGKESIIEHWNRRANDGGNV